jgi:adenylate cyclase
MISGAQPLNLASRMESHGESGTIQITRSTYDLIKGQFDCESRGTIKVKGVDDMEVWHVLRRKADPRPAVEALG